MPKRKKEKKNKYEFNYYEKKHILGFRRSSIGAWQHPGFNEAWHCDVCRVARTHSRYWKLIKFNMRLRHFGHIQ